jgi:hypothetical protein
LVDERKSDRLQGLDNRTHVNGGKQDSVRRETCGSFEEKREYLKDKYNEF